MVDVGAGHGLISRWLVTTRHIAWCIATERNRNTGAQLARLEGMPDLEVRFGNGLHVLGPEDRMDVLVMSGLGARTMVRILAQGLERAPSLERLVLQPQTEPARVRRWLLERGVAIEDERLALDRGRYYVVILAACARPAAPPTHPLLGLADLMEVGPCLVRSGDPLVREYWMRAHERLTRVLDRAGRGPGRMRAARGLALAARVLRALDACEESPSEPASRPRFLL